MNKQKEEKVYALISEDLMREAIVNFVLDYQSDLPYTRVHAMLDTYKETHGDKGIRDLWAWLEWSKNHDIEEKVRVASVFHDLGGREDDTMLPRTDDYYEELAKDGAAELKKILNDNTEKL